MACLSALLFLLAAFPAPAIAAAEEEKPWSAELRLKRYFGSHTSYEFGNPFPPGQTPLSRLEFPMDTWWAGVEIRRDFPRFSAGLEVLGSISRKSDGSLEDSDWDDDAQPKVKTIYSESSCRMEPSYRVRADVDLKVGDWLDLPAWFDLRPVAGIRWQRLDFVTHDGVQYDLTGNTSPDPLPGDGIRFEQTYMQYFLGIRIAYDLGKQTGAAPVRFFSQVDWARVEAHNSDHHLLRPGNRWTYEDTRGYAWHGSFGFKAGLTANLHAGLEFEYLWIETAGSHRMEVYDFDMRFSFDYGVKVWSQQKSVTLSLEYRF
jgi:outer membrane protease